MLKALYLFLIGVLLSASVEAQQRHVNARASIDLNGRADGLRELLALGIGLDHTEVVPGKAVSGDFSTREIDLARQAGFTVEVLIEDVGAHYAQRGTQAPAGVKDFGSIGCPGSEVYPQPQHFMLGSMAGFYTWQEMQDQLDSMLLHFPNLISPKVSIGTSHEGRPIHFVRISNNPNVDQAKPEVLYDALHHAREPASAMQMVYYMWYLLENYATDPQCAYVIDNLELYFVPCVNPDGYVYNETTDPLGGGMWRKNRRDNGDGSFGVDINRNYGYQWGIDDIGSSPDPISDVYRGPGPFSEPETQAIRDFIIGRTFVSRHSHHSRGHLLLYPWGHVDTLCPDSVVFSAHAQRMTEDNGYHFGSTFEALNYLANGSATDWSYGEQVEKPKIFGYVPETGTYIDGFWAAQDRIVPLCQANMEQNFLLALFSGSYAEVQDATPRVVESTMPDVAITIQRFGFQQGTYTVSLEPMANVLSSNGVQTFGSLDTLETSTATIGLTLDPAISDGDVFSYVLVLDMGGYTVRDTIEKVFGVPVIAFDDDCTNSTAWTGNWSLTTETSFSPPSSFADSPFANYNDFDNNAWSLATPIDLSQATSATLNFMAKWTLQSELDHVQVEASDNGFSWTALCGQYSRPGFPAQGEDEPVFDGKRTNWVREEMILDDLVGAPLYLAFRLVSEDNINYEGFHLDDVMITITGQLPSAVVETSSEEPQLTHFPDPATNAFTVSYLLPVGPASTRWSLFDACGAVVMERSLAGSTGSFTVDVGHLASGVYAHAMVGPGLSIAAKRIAIVPGN